MSHLKYSLKFTIFKNTNFKYFKIKFYFNIFALNLNYLKNLYTK